MEEYQQYMEEASHLADKGDTEAAIQVYNSTIEKYPQQVEGYYNLALLYHSIGKVDEAIEDLQKASELNPADASIFNNLGVLYYSKGLMDESEKNLIRAATMDKYYSEPLYGLAKIRIKKGDLPAARSLLEMCLKLNPTYEKAKELWNEVSITCQNSASNLNITPQGLQNGGVPISGKRAEYGEKNAAWYDEIYSTYEHYRLHYTRSVYYPLWSVIVDRIMRAGISSVLDVGCGPGQFATLLRDRGLEEYCGFDFSEKCIRQARLICPDYSFVVADAFETDLFQTFHYDAVVCTEFLEHVECDIEILRQIRSGVRLYGSVPNFMYFSHVRCFKNCDEVKDRYGQLFSEFRVDPLLSNPTGTTFYLLEGLKS